MIVSGTACFLREILCRSQIERVVPAKSYMQTRMRPSYEEKCLRSKCHSFCSLLFCAEFQLVCPMRLPVIMKRDGVRDRYAAIGSQFMRRALVIVHPAGKLHQLAREYLLAHLRHLTPRNRRFDDA